MEQTIQQQLTTEQMILQASLISNAKAPKLSKNLAKVQGELRGIKKNAAGMVGTQRVSYLSGDALLKKLMPLLSKKDILIHTAVYESKMNPRNKVNKNGQEKLVFEFSGILHFQFILGTEIIQGTYPVYGDQFDNTAKAMGTGLTYSDRYFLMKYFKLQTDADDADAQNEPEEKEVVKAPAAAKAAVAKKAPPKAPAKPAAKPAAKKPVVAKKPMVKRAVAKPAPEVKVGEPITVHEAIEETKKPDFKEPVVKKGAEDKEIKADEDWISKEKLEALPVDPGTGVKTFIKENPAKKTELIAATKSELSKLGLTRVVELSDEQYVGVMSVLIEVANG